MSTRSIFRFGDRVNWTWSIVRPTLAQIKFLQFLRRQGFTGKEDVFRYFYFGIFHDGVIRIDEIDATRGTVKLALFNEFLYLEAKTRSKRRLSPKHFFRVFTFEGVSAFEIRHSSPVLEPIYYSAEFWKEHGHLHLVIHFENRVNYIGAITIEFTTVHADDPSDYLRRYGFTNKDLEWWLARKTPSLKDSMRDWREFLRRVRSPRR
jgi:hypothetical protein